MYCLYCRRFYVVSLFTFVILYLSIFSSLWMKMKWQNIMTCRNVTKKERQLQKQNKKLKEVMMIVIKLHPLKMRLMRLLIIRKTKVMVVIQMRWANPLLYLVCCFVVVVYSFVIYWILLWTLSHVRWMHIFYLHSMGFSIDIVKIYINLSFAFYHMLLLLCEVTFTIYPLRFRFFPSLFCYVYPLSIILWLDSHLFLSLVLSQPSSFSSKAWHAWLICAQ